VKTVRAFFVLFLPLLNYVIRDNTDSQLFRNLVRGFRDRVIHYCDITETEFRFTANTYGEEALRCFATTGDPAPHLPESLQGGSFTPLTADLARRLGAVFRSLPDMLVAEAILTHLGYTVTTSTNGEETIELYRKSLETGTPFGVVILDLTIPGGLGGKQTAESILAMSPTACLIVSSGYSNDPIIANYRKYGFRAAIAKPYSIGEFEQVLDALPVR